MLCNSYMTNLNQMDAKKFLEILDTIWPKKKVLHVRPHLRQAWGEGLVKSLHTIVQAMLYLLGSWRERFPQIL